MKKYFIILAFLFISVPTFVNAEKVYTKDYYFEGENPIDYPYKSEDFKLSTYESENKLEENNDRILLEETDYIYNSLSFRYIIINGFEFDIKQHLSEVEVLHNNELITYTYTCTYCYGPAATNLNNGKYYADVDRATYSDFTMTIDLGKNYNPDDISLVISFTNPLRDIISINYNIWFLKHEPIDVNRDSTFDDTVIYKKHFALNENKQDKYTNFPVEILETDIISKVYDNSIMSKEEKTGIFYELISKKNYIYQDKLFKYYKIVDDNEKTIKEQVKTTNIINKPSKNYNNYLHKDSASKAINNRHNNYVYYGEKEATSSKEKITLKEKSEETLKLSNNVYKEKSHIDINLPVLFGIFLMLILLMVYALFKLKKEH